LSALGHRTERIASRLRRELGGGCALVRQKDVDAARSLSLEAEKLLAEWPRFGELVSGMLKLENGP
jgi:hypothetical protein